MNQLKVSLWYLKRIVQNPCSLEIHLAEHCNLNCIGCSHYAPLAEPGFCDLEALEESLNKLSKIRKSIGVIRLLGGEPLLNPDAARVFRLVRARFKDVKIVLVTNGLLLASDKLPEAFWEEAKRCNVVVGLTVYPVPIYYAAIEALCKKHGVRAEIYNYTHGQFSLFKLNPEKKGSRWNYYACGEKECFQLVGNRIYSCPQSAYVGYLNRAFGTGFRLEDGDSISIDDISRFKFLRFRLRSRPFCKYCVFPRPTVAWDHSKRQPEEWIEMSVKSAEQ